MKFAAIALLLLALYNLDGALALSGSNFTFSNLISSLTSKQSVEVPSQNTQAQVGGTAITILTSGYSPNRIAVKAGSKVSLKIVNKDTYTCAQAFTIPSLGLQKVITPGTNATIEFTAPAKTGQIAFMCSMGMYRGVIDVI